ncbi:unnamed protein product, partial [marine sediment metagenome]
AVCSTEEKAEKCMESIKENNPTGYNFNELMFVEYEIDRLDLGPYKDSKFIKL